MLEAVFHRPASPSIRRQLVEDARGILRMQAGRPALGVSGHLLRRVPHDRVEILADERTDIVDRRLSGVDDRGTDSEKVFEQLAGAAQFRLDRLALGFECLQGAHALAQVGQLIQQLRSCLLFVLHVSGSPVSDSGSRISCRGPSRQHGHCHLRGFYARARPTAGPLPGCPDGRTSHGALQRSTHPPQSRGGARVGSGRDLRGAPRERVLGTRKAPSTGGGRGW